MHFVKKLSFAPLFLVSLAILLYQINPILSSYNQLFSFNTDLAWKMAVAAIYITLTSLCFVIFGALSQDWRVVFGVSFIGSTLPAIIFPGKEGLILALIIFLSLIVSFTLLEQKLKTYITFQPGLLLSSSIKNLSFFILVGISVIFYLSANSQIQEKGFEIPDELIDQTIKLASPPQLDQSGQLVKGEKYIAQIPSLTPEQIQLLKQHPELLKQYNIDPAMLDQLPTTQNTTVQNAPQSTAAAKNISSPNPALNNPNVTKIPSTNTATPDAFTSALLKPLIKNQLDSFIKPYTSWIAPILALLFFTTVSSFLWLCSFFISPILGLIFWAFEKSSFITFTKEMREVKKMVV